MVNKVTTRGHTNMGGGVIKAYTLETWENGDGIQVGHEWYELVTNKQYALDLLKEDVPATLKESDDEIKTLKKEMKKVFKDFSHIENTREFIDFVKFYEKPEYKELAELYAKEKAGQDISKFFSIYKKADYSKYLKFNKDNVDLFVAYQRKKEYEGKEVLLEQYVDKRRQVLDWKKQFESVVKEFEGIE